MFFMSRCFSFPLGVSADDRLTSNHIQSRKQTTRGTTAGGRERKERRTTAEGRGKKIDEREEGWRDGKYKKERRRGGKKEGKKATEANRCLRGHINHTLPVWQIDRSLANLPQCTD